MLDEIYNALIILSFSCRTFVKSNEWAKKVSLQPLRLSIPSPNIGRFSNFFHWRILWKTCNNMIVVHASKSLLHLAKYGQKMEAHPRLFEKRRASPVACDGYWEGGSHD